MPTFENFLNMGAIRLTAFTMDKGEIVLKEIQENGVAVEAWNIGYPFHMGAEYCPHP
jgi:hypothetical protein